MPSKRCVRSVERYLTYMGRQAYKQGRERFRIRHDTLAERLGYGKTAIREALSVLRDRGKLDWKRTGRSCIYWLPVMVAGQPADLSATQKSATLGAPESDTRINKIGTEPMATEQGRESPMEVPLERLTDLVRLEAEQAFEAIDSPPMPLPVEDGYLRLPDGSLRRLDKSLREAA